MRFNDYANLLRQLNIGLLAEQEGTTADHIQRDFQSAEHVARDVLGRNLKKADAYASALEEALELRSELSDISSDGNSQIEAVSASKASQHEKIIKITQIVYEAQVLANSKAAKHSQALFSLIQNLLDSDGMSVSARQFGLQSGSSKLTGQLRGGESDAGPLGAGAVEAYPAP